MQKLGELLVRQGVRQEAIALYLKLADILIKQGFSNRAISIYKQILQLNPLLIPVYIKLSEIFKTLGLAKDARLFNQRAVEIVQKSGTIEDVYKLLAKIIEIDPEDAISRIALAETCLKMKNTKMAIEQFEAALPLLREQHLDDLFIRAAERLLYHTPSNVLLCRELSILYMNRKELPKAMKLLLHCRKLDPEDLETLDLLIAHFMSSKNAAKAVLVLLEKAKLLRKKGRDSLAIDAFKKILEFDPGNAEARKQLEAAGLRPPPEAKPRPQPPAAPKPRPRPPAPKPKPFVREPMPSMLSVEVELSDMEPDEAPPQLEALTDVEGKLINEAEIFVKYGLKEKALDHLFKGLEETGNSVNIREKIKDIYLDLGEIQLGLEQLFLLAQQIKDSQKPRAELYLKEILLINPDDMKAQKMLQVITGMSAPPAAEAPEVPVVPLERIVEPAPAGPAAGPAGYESFLEEETVDSRHADSAPDLQGMEEPFIDDTFPPLNRPSLARISRAEITALETETAEDFGPAAGKKAAAPAPPPEPETEPVREQAFSVEVERGPRLPNLDQVLDEADFFASQGLAQEAMMLLEDLLAQYPGNKLLADKIAEYKGGAGAAKQAALDEALMDAPEFSQDISLTEPVTTTEWEREDISTSQAADEAIAALDEIEQIIAPSGAGALPDAGYDFAAEAPRASQVDDAQTHHDLGIAYMEMGLWDQAVSEFRRAADNPQLEATSYNLLGNCLVAAGNIDDAIKEYKMGLFAKNKSQEQELNLYYDIAEAYIQLGDLKESLYYLQNIKKKDAKYKDVGKRILEITADYNKSLRAKDSRAARKRASISPKESAKEVDDAFDALFGGFLDEKTEPSGASFCAGLRSRHV
ncbi:MAG: tetratricopeptide repeat protein, partial [Pseudomonadota bacterium]